MKVPAAVTGLAELKKHLCQREQLNAEECEKALLPSLEHASLVHAHLDSSGQGGERGAGTGAGHATSEITFDQTRNAIVYISLVVIVYVMVIVWLVSANFRTNTNSSCSVSASASAPASASNRSNLLLGSGGFLVALLNTVVGGFGRATSYGPDDDDENDENLETEALLVVQDERGKNKPRCTTHFEEEFEGEPV